MDLQAVESLGYIVPELVLVATILGVFLGDLFVRTKERLGEIALVGVAVSLLCIANLADTPDSWLFSRMIVHDPFAVFFKVVFALATMATVWMSLGSKGRNSDLESREDRTLKGASTSTPSELRERIESAAEL